MLHVAVLALPLGRPAGEFPFPPGPARVLRATLVALVPEPEPAPESAPIPESANVSTPVPPPQAEAQRERKAGTPEKPADGVPPGIVPVASVYFEAAQLTERPRPLAEPALAALEERIDAAGEVRMMLYIDESGRVTAIDVLSSTLPPEIAAEAAAIFSHVPFAPGRIGANAVKSRIGANVGAVSRQSYRR